MTTRHAVAAIAALLLLAPLASAKPKPKAAAGGPPVLTRLDPPAGLAGVGKALRVKIVGKNFAKDGNIVTFGAMTLPILSSRNNGTEIVFEIPAKMPDEAADAPLPLADAKYTVTVKTDAGISNTLVFMVMAR
ncbi:MAG: hypothetical protein HY078_12975 [Elusimicrobia bacterium]|nr:hypothetical protein [Elusimicrobiota bacterium]